MKFIDLFAGIGGFRYGLESVDRKKNRRSKTIAKNWSGKRYPKLEKIKTEGGQLGKHSNTRRLKKQFTCVWSNEWDKYASQIYKKHYGEINTQDIRTVKAREFPKHNLICAGFPCQSFSIAGKRKGFGDTRGTLFYEILRIARFHRTPYLFLENVKGLLNHDKGQTFSVILESLDELGYDCQWQVLNSKNYGVPQNRERVFIIGHLRGKSRPKVFPIKNSDKEVNKTKKLPEQISNTLRTNYSNAHSNETYILADEQNSQKGRDKSDSTNRIRRTSYSNDMRIRRLTPTECERLQGFPDNWTKYGKTEVTQWGDKTHIHREWRTEKISDTQRYKCLGNAVTTNVITAIGEKLIKVI
jgi:DNA (cytosine-5)-methyltransferase 1